MGSAGRDPSPSRPEPAHGATPGSMVVLNWGDATEGQTGVFVPYGFFSPNDFEQIRILARHLEENGYVLAPVALRGLIQKLERLLPPPSEETTA